MNNHNCNQDKTIERVLNNVEKIQDELKTMNTTLIKNTESLEQHMRRTEILEETIKPMNKWFNVVSTVAGLAGFILIILNIIKAL